MTASSPVPSGPREDVRVILRSIAATAIDDPDHAGELPADRVGQQPSLAGERRLRLLTDLAPELVAEAVALATGRGDDRRLWAPTRPDGAELSVLLTVVVQIVVRHLNDEPEVAHDIVAAYSKTRGIQGLWDLGVTALNLLTAELRDQRGEQQARALAVHPPMATGGDDGNGVVSEEHPRR